jgi:hypothetical protein
MNPLEILKALDDAAATYDAVAEAWEREGLSCCARLNARAAIVCRETRDALAQLRADEGAELGIEVTA